MWENHHFNFNQYLTQLTQINANFFYLFQNILKHFALYVMERTSALLIQEKTQVFQKMAAYQLIRQSIKSMNFRLTN